MPDALINSHGPSIPLAINYTLWPCTTFWAAFELHNVAGRSIFLGLARLYVLWSGHALHPMIWPCVSFCGEAMLFILRPGLCCFTIESCILVSHFHTVHFLTYSQQTVYEFIFEFFLIFFLLWLIKFIQSKFVILSNGSLLFRIIK